MTILEIRYLTKELRGLTISQPPSTSAWPKPSLDLEIGRKIASSFQTSKVLTLEILTLFQSPRSLRIEHILGG